MAIENQNEGDCNMLHGFLLLIVHKRKVIIQVQTCEIQVQRAALFLQTCKTWKHVYDYMVVGRIEEAECML